MRILLVEKTRSAATSHIRDDRFLVACAEDGDEAMTLLRHDTYDLVLLSMGAQQPDGLRLIRDMRRRGDDTPVLALTGPRAEDRIEALRFGADEAMAEPVDPTELPTRMIAVLRRDRGGGQSLLRLGDLSLCRIAREARFGDTPVKLTPKEFAMLELMVLRKGTILTKATFLGHLYDDADDEPDGRIIDLFVCKIRRKLEHAGAGDLISTVWGHGYMIRDLGALMGSAGDVALPMVRPGSGGAPAYQRVQVRSGLSFDVWTRRLS